MIATGNPVTVLGRLPFDAVDDDALADGVRALVTPTFTFRQEGDRTDADGFIAHLRDTRAATSGGEVTVLDELVDDSAEPVRVATRILVHLHWADGSTDEVEEQMIGVLDGGLLDALHEEGRFLRPGDDRPEPTPTLHVARTG